MTKTLKLFATLRDLVGEKTIDIPFEDGQSVRDLIATIGEHYPDLQAEILDDQGELTGLVHVMVHGRNIQWLEGMDTVVREKDIIVLMPPSAGG